MVDPRTDEDRIRGIVQAASMDPIPVSKGTDYVLKEISDTTDASSGVWQTQTIEPPSNRVYRVVDFWALCPSVIGAGSGTHYLHIYTGDRNLGVYLESNYGNSLGFKQGTMFADVTSRPNNAGDIWEIVTSLFATLTHPLTFDYYNDTDTGATATRQFKVVVLEMPLVE